MSAERPSTAASPTQGESQGRTGNGDSHVVFEHAVVRVVPRVEREEFVNVGVIVYCQATDYLEAAVDVDRDRLGHLDPEADLEAIEAAVGDFVESFHGAGQHPKGEQFRWLTAPRSTIVQTGPVHAGLTEDPAAELRTLMERLVT